VPPASDPAAQPAFATALYAIEYRHGHRDATMILVTYRHGLRATEVCQLRWDQYDLKRGSLHVNRIKNGIESVHPVGGEELRALRKRLREAPDSRYVFVSERGPPLSARKGS
jgi:integrase